jgi:hypothetical protein
MERRTQFGRKPQWQSNETGRLSALNRHSFCSMGLLPAREFALAIMIKRRTEEMFGRTESRPDVDCE